MISIIRNDYFLYGIDDLPQTYAESGYRGWNDALPDNFESFHFRNGWMQSTLVREFLSTVRSTVFRPTRRRSASQKLGDARNC